MSILTSEKDGAVRLYPSYTYFDRDRIDFDLKEGQILWLTDGDVEVMGKATFRDGLWVVIPDEKGFNNVDENAPYHIKSLPKK